MTAMSAITSLPPTTESARPRRGWPGVAWVVILGLIGVILWRNGVRPKSDSALWLVPMQMQGRYLVGAATMGTPTALLYQQAEKSLNRGVYSQRLRFVVLAGELAGPDEALRQLKELRANESLIATASAAEVTDLLERLYQGEARWFGGPFPLDESEKATLRTRLGWFGDLAVAPRGSDPVERARAITPARRTFFAMIFIGLLALLGLGIGTLLLVLVGVLCYLGLLRGEGVRRGGNGGVYAETFALYMSLFLGLNYLARFLPWHFEGLWFSGLLMLLSLTAMLWPVLRGVSWREARRELGIGSNRVFVDLALGVGTYLSALPLLGLGILVMLGLMFVQRKLGLDDPHQMNGPSHPIIGEALAGTWWVWLQMFVVACVLAPLVEEIMFRGALYQHLREIGPGLAKWVSVIGSTLVSGLVFAMIHPQGWLGVPPLFALASAFALSREWRGSLLPGMVAHGINNGMSMLFLFILTR